MLRYSKILCLLVGIICSGVATGQSEKAAAKKVTSPRPIKISDVAKWQRISQFTLSRDGAWVAHVVMPGEGDGTITIAQREGKKKHAFEVGPGSGQIRFSHDAKFAAFVQAPKFAAAKAARKAKTPLKSKGILLNLESGDKVEFDAVQSLSFSGEQPKYLAIRKPKPSGRPSGDAGWDGSDLLLYDIVKKTTVNIGNVKSFSFNKAGTYLALLIDAEGKSGNGLQLLKVSDASIHSLESGKASYRSMSWNRAGDAIVLLREKKDKAYENSQYHVLAFTGIGAGERTKIEIDPTKVAAIPDDMTVTPNRSPQWSFDGELIIFGVHPLKKKEVKPASTPSKTSSGTATKKPASKGDSEVADLVVWHWKDKRLQSHQQKQESADKNRSEVCVYRVKTKKTLKLSGEEIPSVSLRRPYKFAVGTDNRKYQWMGNLDGRRYSDIYAIDITSGKRKLVLEKARYFFGISPNGTTLLYYQDGHFFVYNAATGKHQNISENVKTSFVNTEDDHNVVKPPRSPVGWTSDGNHALLSDGWDIWKVNIDGSGGQSLTVNGKKDGIRYSNPHRFDPDIDGIDPNKPIYVAAYGEWTKKAGFGRIQPGKTGVQMLAWDDANFRPLRKLKEKDVYYYSRSTHQKPSNYFVAGPDLKKPAQVTQANAQHKDFKWSAGVKLVNYTSPKGDKLQGALYLPADYIEGKKYPTIVYMYEKLSQRANTYNTPRHGGFSQSLYCSNGYAVFNPDIVFRVNDPGVASKECIMAGLEAAVKTGVIDEDRIGLHGHSWGGYQTAFLITQTNKFKAAIAGAPLTNLISMYSSIYWNSGWANQPIFESRQGRFKGGYWSNIDAYTRNSPVYHADKVSTPLLLLHNDLDGAVDWNQGIEYFNTLRRLKKPVVMLQYKGENHGLRKTANRKDYSYRMMEYFDHHLKGKPAPKWWSEGIKHLDMKKHVKEFKKNKEAK